MPSKVPQSIKEMVEKALQKAGGVDYLTRQAEENPVAFMGLIGKIVPLQLAAGDGSSPVQLHLLAAIAVSAELAQRNGAPQTIDSEQSQSLPANLLDAPTPAE
jgi:hypothetical protein